MARFKALIEGSTGSTVARTGEHVAALVHGQVSGVEVHAVQEDGVDLFHVYATRGEKRTLARWHLGTVRLDDHGVLSFERERPDPTGGAR
jgi:hypothetical protein